MWCWGRACAAALRRPNLLAEREVDAWRAAGAAFAGYLSRIGPQRMVVASAAPLDVASRAATSTRARQSRRTEKLLFVSGGAAIVGFGALLLSEGVATGAGAAPFHGLAYLRQRPSAHVGLRRPHLVGFLRAPYAYAYDYLPDFSQKESCGWFTSPASWNFSNHG